MRFDRAPLLVRDPLDITKETLAAGQRCLLIVRQTVQPIARCLDRLMLGRPSVPCGAIVIRLHQDPEECVITQPRGLFVAERSEFRSSFYASVSREIRKRFLQQAPIQFFYSAILYCTRTEGVQINIGNCSVKVFSR